MLFDHNGEEIKSGDTVYVKYRFAQAHHYEAEVFQVGSHWMLQDKDTGEREFYSNQILFRPGEELPFTSLLPR